MSKNCSNCAFFTDYCGTQFASIFADGLTGRCLKEARIHDGWPPPVRRPDEEWCDHYLTRDPLRARWEWDENKNQRTIKERGVSFQEAIGALESDPFHIRSAVADPSKWEKLEDLDFEALGILSSSLNRDPIRDEHLFSLKGKLYVLISTLRGEVGNSKQRIISLRRTSDPDHISRYEWAREQAKNGKSFV